MRRARSVTDRTGRRDRENEGMTGTEQHDEARAEVAGWAQRLAQRRVSHDAAQEREAVEDWTTGAIRSLWTIFDDAVEEANRALADRGAPEQILLHRTMREYRLSMVGPDGGERQITVFASLSLVGGHRSGGALISTNQTRATIYLVASSSGRHMRWTVAATGTPFTERMVGDLFLSVFGDDPAATMRLSSYYTVSP